MPKILLINPPFNIAKENYDSSVSVGLLSIASYLAREGIAVEIIDGARQADYLALIKKQAPRCDFFGLSVMTTQIDKSLEICRLIRELNPKGKIIWGGAHPTFFPEKTARQPLVDIVCLGEGELTLAEIVFGKNLAAVKGITYKNNGQIISNPWRELHDPAQMPLFNWELEPPAILKNLKLVPSLTSRGCPHRCTFCLNAILRNKWRPRTVEQVLADLAIIKSQDYFAGKKIRFWDENFFVDISRAKAIISGLIEKDLVLPWETTVRADYFRAGMIDEEFAAQLKKSGCYLLSFGAESGSPAILRKIKKDIVPEQVLLSAKVCLKHGIIPQYSFMIGLPGETKADMNLTIKLIDRLVKLSPQVQILGPQAFRPYPGSVLYQECLQAGWQEPESLEAWAALAKNELSYLTVKNFTWVKDKNFVEAMESYVRFGAHGFKSAMGSSVKARRLLKFGFVLLCQLRWRLKFFAWPFDYQLAKKFVVK